MRGWLLALRLGRKMGLSPAVALREWRLMLERISAPRLDEFGLSAGKVRMRFEELLGENPLAWDCIDIVPGDGPLAERRDRLRVRLFTQAVVEVARRALARA